MGGGNWTTMLIAVGLTLFMAVIPPAMLGGDNDALRNFIYEFQTLIGGVLAVGAAFLTVWQMRETDRRADERHRQLIEEGRRTDKAQYERHRELMLVERDEMITRLDQMVHFTAAGLRETGQRLLMQELVANPGTLHDWIKVYSAFNGIVQTAAGLEWHFIQDAYIEGAKYLSGATTAKISRFRDHVRQMRDAAQLCLDASHNICDQLQHTEVWSTKTSELEHFGLYEHIVAGFREPIGYAAIELASEIETRFAAYTSTA